MPFPRARLPLVLLAALALVLLLPAPAFAQSGSTSNRAARGIRYDVDIAIEGDGRMVVRETQEIAFTGGPFQKATRRIPLRRVTRIDGVRVEVDGQPSRRGTLTPGTFSLRGEQDGPSEGELIVEYWFPPTANARRTFLLEYTVTGALAYYQGGDQLRWNAIPIDHGYPIQSSAITLRLPASTNDWKTDAYPRSLLDPERPTAAQGATATWHARNLPPNQPLEIRAQWPHGLVAGSPPPWQEAADRETWRRENLRPVLNLAFGAAGLLVPFGGLIALLLTWYSQGRDPNIGPVPAELDEPPSDLPPALVGVVADEHADVQDVIATVLDLAARGVIRVEEIADRKLVGSHRDFKLELVDRDRATRPYEQTVLNSLFPTGDEVRLSRLGDWFGAWVPRLQASLHSAAQQEGLFASDPEVVRRRFQRLGTLVMGLAAGLGIVTCSVASEYTDVALWPFLGLLVVGAVMRFTAGAMPRRTAAGALEAARWRAYSNYLRRVGPAAWREGTVNDDGLAEQVERTLPYAVALGVDREWVQKFASVGAPAPRWMRRADVPDGVPGMPPVIVVGGGPWGGPWGGGYGGGYGGGHGRAPSAPADPAAPAGAGEVGDTPVLGNDPFERGSNSLNDLIETASEVLGRGGGSGWSGGGFGGGWSSGGGGGGGGGGSSFE